MKKKSKVNQQGKKGEERTTKKGEQNISTMTTNTKSRKAKEIMKEYTNE